MPSERDVLIGQFTDYLSRFMGADIASAPTGTAIVVSTKRRCQQEASYGRAFPVVILVTGKRSVISARPELAGALRDRFCHRKVSQDFLSETTGEYLATVCRQYLPKRSAPDGWEFSRSLIFTCHKARTVTQDPRAKVIDPTSQSPAPRARGMGFRRQQLGEKGQVARFVVYRGRTVAESYTISVGHRGIGSVGVETAPGFRNRGFGKMALAALTRHILRKARVPHYTTSYHNAASINLALSVGYRLWGRMLRVQPR